MVGIELRLPDFESVRLILAQSNCKPTLLHMDARPENLLTWKGNIRSIIDWSNALVGSAALDQARIGEYGYLSSEMLSGYGLGGNTEVPPIEETIYRIDAAVMLSVVFLSEAPDAERAAVQVARVVELYDAFWRECPRYLE